MSHISPFRNSFNHAIEPFIHNFTDHFSSERKVSQCSHTFLWRNWITPTKRYHFSKIHKSTSTASNCLLRICCKIILIHKKFSYYTVRVNLLEKFHIPPRASHTSLETTALGFYHPASHFINNIHPLPYQAAAEASCLPNV
jgi:hypothetical protein